MAWPAGKKRRCGSLRAAAILPHHHERWQHIFDLRWRANRSSGSLGFSGFLVREIAEPIGHTGTGLRRGLKDANARTNLIDVFESRITIKSTRLCDIDLCEDGGIGGVEQCGIFERLVFTFSYAEQRYANLFAEVVARGADEIADIFDEQVVEVS